MRALMCTMLVAMLATSARADLRQEHLSAAEHAFALGVKSAARPMQARKHFAEASDRYHALHDLGVRDSALYLNLGNVAVLADRWPEALWAYHVGLKLEPNDARLRAHREQVRAKVALPPYGQGRNEPEFWPVWLHRPSLDRLMLTAVLLHGITCVIAATVYVRPTSSFARVALLFAFLVTMSALGGASYEFRQRQIDHDTPLVVVADNTPLYRGNGPNYPAHPDIAILPRGLEARQIHRRGAWLQIKLTSGEVGWIPAERAFVVLP